jgi:hypothetical protein
MTAPHGIHDHPTLKLGRKPSSNAPRLKLSSFLDVAAVPVHDPTDDNLLQYPFQLYKNDTYGDCGPTSVGNNVISVSHGTDVPALSDVLDLYKRSGNPGFPADDNGVIMQDMLNALLAGGLGSRKPVAFAAVDHANDTEMEAAIFTFDGVLLGVDLETAQQGQTNAGVWDYKFSGEWGGHAIYCGKYVASTGRLSVVTWAKLVQTTQAFRTHQLDEAWVVVWPEHLNRPGVDRVALAEAFRELTGKTLPLSPAPGPDPDVVLWESVKAWADGRHTGDNKKAAAAVKAWAAAKGL